MKSFQFLFDVGGPNGYLVHRVLPAFCAEHGARAEYVPVLLGGLFKATGNRPPLMRYADAPAKWAYEQLEFDRFIQANGINRFRMNPNFPPNSLQAMRAIVGAKALDCQEEAIEAFMVGVWETELNLGDRDAVEAHLNAAGLDGAALLARADEPEVKAELIANTEAAVARGAFGIPTFFVGDEMFFGKERLGQVAAAVG
ncbi:MAG: 2-hydroxychromene-2-carboxylate isomerase [Sphingopyxis sp.]|nr:2-hydroxychromene-2-carboxylate isomerase [Sphingopyxis sp.]